ncbi:hypothetical protein D041_0572B, partial [Vibrio parahaemolyticus EKP-008]
KSDVKIPDLLGFHDQH